MGTFYHTTNYNPLTGDLNNMAKPMKMKPGVLYAYNSENGTFKLADKDDEPFDKDGNDNSPRIPQPWGGGDWAGKKKKSKKA